MIRQLRPADDLLAPAVHDMTKELQLRPEDTSAARLAHQYAAAIDDAAADDRADVLAKLGPKLLDALEALGATPRARARKGGTGAPITGKLAAIRTARPA